MRPAALILAALLAACGPVTLDPPDCDAESCAACASCAACSGVAKLEARTLADDYEAATISFEHATTAESDAVLNDWDLLFGNDKDPSEDSFSVNMVTDDRSFIVDLGHRVSFCDVPAAVDPSAFPVGAFGEHDDIPVALGHVYLIRTVDTETRQWAAAWVVEHEPNRSVTISWYRSPAADRFVPPPSCE